jgi:hypothetical protein
MTKKEPKVTLNITQGKTSPAQKHAWDTFWRKLITEALKDIK